MGDGFSTSIQVVGLLRGAAACRELCMAIQADRPAARWLADTDADPAMHAGEILASYLDAAQPGADLLSERFRHSLGFRNIEAACMRRGLGFVRTIYPDGGHRGSVSVFHPGEQEAREWELGTVPVPSAAGLLALVEGPGSEQERLESVRRELHLILDHRYGLSDSLEADAEARSACTLPGP